MHRRIRAAIFACLGAAICGALLFTQDADGLQAPLPANAPCKYAYSPKITRLQTNSVASARTVSGNPLPTPETTSPIPETTLPLPGTTMENTKPVIAPAAPAAPDLDVSLAASTAKPSASSPAANAPLPLVPLSEAPTQGAWGDRGDGTYANPVIPADFSDLDAIRVGADYYAISSTFQYSPGMAVLHSRDLVNWKIISHAVPDVTQIGPDLNWDRMNRYGRGVWAGAVRYHAGRFWIYFNTPDEGFFMTSATNPAGPWEPLRCLWRTAGWDDPCPFWDDDGRAYLVATHFADGYKIHLFGLSMDGKTLRRDEDRVIHQSRGSEANKLYKINGLYYHLYSEVRSEGRVVMMNRAKSLAGPWETRQLNHVNRHLDKEPNQGGLMELPDGNWQFFTHQGSGDWEGRAACLLPVVWQDGWPLLGRVGADGIGGMVWRAKKPIAGFELASVEANDDFDQAVLQPAWEWNHQPRPEMWSLGERPGWLRLRAFAPLKAGDFKTAGNTLTQRAMRTPHNVVTAKLDIGGMTDGQRAGLAHYARSWCTFGVSQAGRVRTLTLDEDGHVSAGPTIAQNRLWLRSTWGYDGQSQFAYSLDGKTYTPFGPAYALTWGSYRGDRIGLFTYTNTKGNDTKGSSANGTGADGGGYVDVDWFRYTVARQATPPTEIKPQP